MSLKDLYRKKLKKARLKILKGILIGVSIYIAILLIETGIIYAVKGAETWNYLKEALKWHFSLLYN